MSSDDDDTTLVARVDDAVELIDDDKDNEKRAKVNSHAGTSSGECPLYLKPSTFETLVVELNDPGLSLTNDTGIIGRFIAPNAITDISADGDTDSGSANESSVTLDIKGHIYSGVYHSSPTLMIVVQHGNECRVDSLVHCVATVTKSHESLRETISGDLADIDDNDESYIQPSALTHGNDSDSNDEYEGESKKKKKVKKSSSSKSSSVKSASKATGVVKKPAVKRKNSVKSKSSSAKKKKK